MNPGLDFNLMLINAVFTLLIGVFIVTRLQANRFQKHFFYYAWAIGFLSYGFQIVLRSLDFSVLIWGPIMLISFGLFIAGTWLLTRKKTVYLVVLVDVLLVVALTVLFVNGVLDAYLGQSVGYFVLTFSIILGIIDQRVVFGRNVDKLIIGWALLIFTNTVLWEYGIVSDVLAILSKSVILLGIVDYDFVIITKRIQRGFDHLDMPIMREKREGGLKLVIPPVKNGELWKSKGVDWIVNQVHESLDIGKYAYLFSFKDVLPHQDLLSIKLIEPDKIRVFVFSNTKEQSEKGFTVLSPELLKIGVTINEIAKKQVKYLDGAVLFFADLSAAIHTIGEYPVYRLLLDKMGVLRESGITMFAVFLPKTHDESVVSLFYSIADDVIRL